MSQPVGTLLKAIDLIEELARGGPARVMELSRELGMEKSATSRVLATLRSRNFVRLLTDGRYDLGLRLYELGKLLQDRLPFRAMIAPHVDALAARTEESAYCVIYHYGEATYLYECLSNRELRLSSRVGQRWSPFEDVAGKTVLAYQEEEAVKKLLDAQREANVRGLPDWKKLRMELSAIRKRGYALDQRDGIQIIVAPLVRNEPPHCHAALLIGGPAFRMRGAVLRRCTAQLQRAALEAGQEYGNYGGLPPDPRSQPSSSAAG